MPPLYVRRRGAHVLRRILNALSATGDDTVAPERALSEGSKSIHEFEIAWPQGERG
jgi:hypothetical protein